jgi:hypothetical protein
MSRVTLSDTCVKMFSVPVDNVQASLPSPRWTFVLERLNGRADLALPTLNYFLLFQHGDETLPLKTAY